MMMKWYRSSIPTLAVLFITFNIADATFYEYDLNNPGDKLVTYSDITKQYIIDTSYTYKYTLDEIIIDTGKFISRGFHLGTFDEVENFLGYHLGGCGVNNYSPLAADLVAKNGTSLMGSLYYDSIDLQLDHGLYRPFEITPIADSYGNFWHGVNEQPISMSDNCYALLISDNYHPLVPEPGTLVLFATGLCGLVIWKWEKQS